MSELERRRGYRALVTSPQQFADEELTRLAQVIGDELVARTASKFTYQQLRDWVAGLCLGAGTRLRDAVRSAQKIDKTMALVTADVLNSDPRHLLVCGLGPTSIIATLIAVLFLGGGSLPPIWRTPPTHELSRLWNAAMALQRTDPARFESIATRRKSFMHTNSFSDLILDGELTVT